MGSATRQALAAARAVLDGVSESVDLTVGSELLALGRLIGDSNHLLSALSDPGAPADAKSGLAARVFGDNVSATTRTVVDAVVTRRWSRATDLLAGIEELGLRALQISAPAEVSLERELFRIGQTIASNAELELALGSKLGSSDPKIALLDRLFGSVLSAQALIAAQHLVLQPRGRRVGELFRGSETVVADQAGYVVAVVTVARPISDTQLSRLAQSLSESYGQKLTVNQVVDPAIIGGMRVTLGDDVIDGTVSSQLNDLRMRLAG